MKYDALKALVNAKVYENTEQRITGGDMNTVLQSAIASLGAHYQMGGLVSPADHITVGDEPVVFLATTPGTYTYFGGLVVADGEVALLVWSGTAWSKQTPDIATGTEVSQLGQKTDAKTVGTTNELITPEINQDYFIRAGDGLVISANNFAYTAKFFASKGQVIFSKVRGYSQNVSIISKVITEGSSYTPLVISIDSTIREYTYHVEEDGYYAVCFNYNYPWHIELVSNAPADLVSRIQQNDAYKKFFIGKGNALAKSPDIYNLKPGNKYRISLKVVPWDMTGVTVSGVGKFSIQSFYNGTVTSLAYVDMSQVPAEFYDITIPENSDYVRIGGRAAGGTIVYFGISELIEIADGSVTTIKLADDSITKQKLADNVKEELIKQVRTANLYDESQRIDGYFVSNNGNINPVSGWAVTPYIPVSAGNKYTISCKSSARGQGISWFNSNKVLVSGGGGNIYGTHTAPENAAYLVFNVGANNAYSTEVMVVEGEESVPFVPYKQIETSQVKGLDAALDAIKVGPLKITKNGNSIVIADGGNYISAVLNKNAGNQFGGNPVFNFVGYKYNGQERTNNDDIAPLHVYNTTIGANHGQPCVKATIASHGLDNTAIGTGWSKDGVTYYVMRIVDADNVIFLSENRGSSSSPSFVALTTGTLTKGGDTLVVTEVASSQLYPALKNHSITLSLDGESEIVTDRVYQCNYIDIVESYDIMNPVSTLSKIIARVGQSGEPVYDGDAGIHIENTYHITNNLAIVVISNLVPLETIAFSDAMFSQMLRIGNNGTCKYYVPNSLPLGNGGQYDMRKPLAMTWGSSVPTLKIGASQMADPQHPVNRIVQYNGSLGAALGFLTDRGVGSALLNFTNYVFELRNDAGKVYPHGVDTKVGSTLSSGQIFSAVLYRALFIPESVGNRLSMYHFDLAGAEYVYVDYKASMLDKVSVSRGLNGKKIEVLESSNCQLKSDVYNDGFYVDATYVNDETCYLIAKII